MIEKCKNFICPVLGRKWACKPCAELRAAPYSHPCSECKRNPHYRNHRNTGCKKCPDESVGRGLFPCGECTDNPNFADHFKHRKGGSGE